MLKKYKKEYRFSYSFGVYPTIELLKYKGDRVKRIYINPKGDKNKGIDEILYQAKRWSIPVETNKLLIDKLTQNENTYAMAVFNKYDSTISKGTNHLVLDKPSDMGNLGTICRTMLAFNIRDLALLGNSADYFDPKVIRSSMGALFQLNIQNFKSFDEYRSKFNNSLYTFMTSGSNPLNKINFKKPFSLIFGNEGEGLSDDFKNYGISISIPQSKNVDSLNLSIAVGISLYESALDYKG